MTDYFDFGIYKLKEAASGTIISVCDKSFPKFIIILKSDNYKKEVIEFLSKVFASISVDLSNECTVISFDNKEILTFENIFKFGFPKYIISFGIDSCFYDIQASLKKRDWNNFENFSLLIFDNIQEVQINQDLKRKLWEQLKTLK